MLWVSFIISILKIISLLDGFYFLPVLVCYHKIALSMVFMILTNFDAVTDLNYLDVLVVIILSPLLMISLLWIISPFYSLSIVLFHFSLL